MVKALTIAPRDILPDVQPDLSAFKATPPKVTGVATYTPPNWSNSTPQLYCITYRVPIANTSTIKGENVVDNPDLTTKEQFRLGATANEGLAGYNAETRTVMLVFDAIKRAQHSQTATVTQHPLQAGYNIADHIIKQASRITLEVAMSDAIASYTLAGYTPMWRMNPSKSVSAYQQMEMLMINRQLVTINTRLDTYDNMALIDIEVEDSARTYCGGLAMALTFQEVFIADVVVSYESARMQSTGDTKQGTVQPQAPSQTVVAQHKLTTLEKVVGKPMAAALAPRKIPGAGVWSSAILSFPTRGF